MKPQRPVFLARQGYRRRRLMDAARALPVLGAFLFLIPLLWSGEDGGGAPTRVGVVYLFIIWAVLIASAGWLARYLRHHRGAEHQPRDEEPRE